MKNKDKAEVLKLFKTAAEEVVATNINSNKIIERAVLSYEFTKK